jgi:hypothetical protein
MADIVLTTEVINDFNKIIQKAGGRNRPVQKGGFVFSLIASITEVMGKVTGTLVGAFWGIRLWLFNIDINKIDKETGSYKFVSLPEGEGNVWRFILFCIKTALYLVIFALGGFWFTIAGIVFVYSKLGKKFTEMKSGGSSA